MRLFAALPLSSAAVDRLTRLRLRLSGPGDGLRWTNPEQWHITLEFFGEVASDFASTLQLAFGRRAPSPSPLHLAIDGLGMFASKGILFAAVEPSPALLDLQQRVARAAGDCGFQPESRPFRPHVTLARSKGKPGHKTLQKLATPELPSLGASLSWSADEVLLLESTLSPQGATYTSQGRLSLVAPPEPQASEA